jgi:hypothetical protein
MNIPYTNIDQIYVNGAWVSPEGGTEAVINPATEEVIGHAPVASLPQVDAAIAAAREAFDNGPWPTMTMDDRAGYMDKMVAALHARQTDIAALIVAEVGCAQGITHMMQVANPINHLISTIKYARRDESERLPIDINPNMFAPDGPQNIGGTTVVREPFGVVSAITGYNFPFLLNLAKIGPALMAGCTFASHALFGIAVRRDLRGNRLAEGRAEHRHRRHRGGSVALHRRARRYGHLHRLRRRWGKHHGAGRAHPQKGASRTWRQVRDDCASRCRRAARSRNGGGNPVGQRRPRLCDYHAVAGA